MNDNIHCGFWSKFAEVRIPGSTSNCADRIRPFVQDVEVAKYT